MNSIGTADHSSAAVTIEERIGWVTLWEMALNCGERSVRRIHAVDGKGFMPLPGCFGEDCTCPHVGVTEEKLSSNDTNLRSVFFFAFRISSCFVMYFELSEQC